MDSQGRLRNLDRLRHVPVFALRLMLANALGADASLTGKTGEELIALADESPEVSAQDVDELFEDYRYGARPSFFLHLLNGSAHTEDAKSVQAWNTAIQDYEEKNESPLRLRVCDIDPIDLTTMELRFRYQIPHEYIDPADESPARVEELLYGFLWVDVDHGYMVLMSKHEHVNEEIRYALASVMGCSALPVRLNKKIINGHFEISDMTRASYRDGQKGISRSIAGEDLYQIAGEEVDEQERSADRMASLYNERVRFGLNSKAGIHLKKGKIYLTRTIRATDLRQWLRDRIRPLVDSIRTSSASVRAVSLSAPVPALGLSQAAQSKFQELIGCILSAREDTSVQPVWDVTYWQMTRRMQGLFVDPSPLVFCPECEEVGVALCGQCGGYLEMTKSGFSCADCAPVSGETAQRVQCANGHQIQPGQQPLHVELRPRIAMQKAVASYIQDNNLGTYNTLEEFFWIDGQDVHYRRNSRQSVYLADDIAEYSDLPVRDQVPEVLWAQAEGLLSSMKEKCAIDLLDGTRQPGTQDCEICCTENTPRWCIPKLFRALDPHYVVVPHTGSEFGDVGLSLKVGGVQRTFVGLAKRSDVKKPGPIASPIRLKHGTANDIERQIIRQVMRDPRVQSFGIIVPRPLEEGLRAEINMLAGMCGKPVVYFGWDELVRMTAALLVAEGQD